MDRDKELVDVYKNIKGLVQLDQADEALRRLTDKVAEIDQRTATSGGNPRDIVLGRWYLIEGSKRTKIAILTDNEVILYRGYGHTVTPVEVRRITT